MKGRMWETRLSFHQMKTLVMALLLTSSITWILWMSLDTFWNIQHTLDEMQATIGLEQDVSLLRAQYLAANPKSLEADLEQADRLLIQDLKHLAQWAQELQQQGQQLNLGMQYRILKTRQGPAPVEGLALVPMEIQVSPRGTRSAYRPYLQFLQTLERSGPRIDIQEVTVMGDGEKATHLTVGLSVWMKNSDSVEL